MVALGCGIALLPDVVLENSPDPVRNRVLLLENIDSVAPFELGICVQKKRLGEPLIVLSGASCNQLPDRKKRNAGFWLSS